jgi:hypothetical protein
MVYGSATQLTRLANQQSLTRMYCIHEIARPRIKSMLQLIVDTKQKARP